MKTAYAKHIFSLLLFGANGIVASYIPLSSLQIVLLRTALGSLFLAAVFFSSGGRLTFYRHKKAFAALAVSGIAMGASWLFLYEAYTQIGVSLASLAYYCGPVIVMILSPLLFGERLTQARVFSFLTVLLGIFLVNGSLGREGGNLWGLFCGAMSAVCYALMVIFNKKAGKIPGLENAMLQLVTSFLLVAVFVGIKGGYPIPISIHSLLPILVLGLVGTGFGCWLYFSSIGALPVQTVSICGYLEALSAVIFSVLFLHETLLPAQIAGAVFIVGGAIFGELKKPIG
ncbi:MAG: EamA family transporter [Clostridia bacterium]|nr:EamA family transporter [Clostridia bacterium]